ncbi:transposase [Desulfofundulus luciae]|uniref:Transposase n=1 Tax=Desulfofundulus luciae TaxID=74702 RepID=A0ABU0B581_9FIRM|nr:transposase [Desulfofundulus luciae]MDQ0287879.1 transposase [Desulfofundulus luciae]
MRFSGNTADVNTFSQIIADVRERFQLTRVVFVGDRGMVSQDILKDLDEKHIEYIVGMRMRKVKDVGEVLGGRYRIVKGNLKVKEVWYDADRYIVCHNPVQAEHDKKARVPEAGRTA